MRSWPIRCSRPPGAGNRQIARCTIWPADFCIATLSLRWMKPRRSGCRATGRPWSHQLAAWEAARDGLSCVVSSGTGSGKTECFMIPMLDDLLREEAAGLPVGVRAIVIYPLNALIESQCERLTAWTAPIKDRVRFALYNGLTPRNAATRGPRPGWSCRDRQPPADSRGPAVDTRNQRDNAGVFAPPR